MGTGESAGEAVAKSLFEAKGMQAIAAQLDKETWEEDAFKADLPRKDDTHPYHFRAYCEVFARGARRWAEMCFQGFRDAQTKTPRSQAAKERLGKHLSAAYDIGFASYKEKS